MLRVALRPRFLGLLALMIAATVVCGMLASWQWDRAHSAIVSRAAEAERLGPLTDLIAVGDPVTNDIVGGVVEATGTFAPQEQVYVPGRVVDGTEAVIVVTALHVQQADGSEARIPVARGWIPAADIAGPGGTVDPSAVPPPPSGEVTISGMIEASEAATAGIHDGMATEIATPQLVNAWGAPMYAGYIAQTSPAEGLRPMPESGSAFTAGLDWQNLGYALQWVLFGGFFLYLWWRSVRTTYLDEQAERREAALAQLARAEPAERTASTLSTEETARGR